MSPLTGAFSDIGVISGVQFHIEIIQADFTDLFWIISLFFFISLL